MKSFSPLIDRLKKYLIEIILLTTALVITITALVIFFKNNQEFEEDIKTPITQYDKELNENIFVDISGAIKEPGLYKMVFGARIKDVIDKGGGLSDEADQEFFSRNFNLARILTDQEKIYIPSALEVNDGIFIQTQRTLDYSLPSEVQINEAYQQAEPSSLININSASIQELDQLSGVGEVTANKIISGRPYNSLEELLTKKIVNKSVYEKIKNQVSL